MSVTIRTGFRRQRRLSKTSRREEEPLPGLQFESAAAGLFVSSLWLNHQENPSLPVKQGQLEV
jgi:hypothetical protein